MDYRHTLRTIVRFWPLIVTAFLLGGVGGYTAYRHTTPLYASSTQLVVGWTDSNVPDGRSPQLHEEAQRALAKQRASVLAQLAPTEPAVSAVLQAIGEPQATVAVAASADSPDSVLTIAVLSPDPALSADVSNGFQAVLVKTLTASVGPLDSQPTLKTVAPGLAAARPVTPILWKDLAWGGIAGLLLGLAVAVAADVLGRLPQTTDEVASLTDLDPLGTVPRHPRRAGLPTFTAPESAASESYRAVRTSILSWARPPTVIAITSTDAGEGKTTIATNLATALHQAGASVVVIDVDMRHLPRSSRGAQTEVGLVDVLAGTAPLDAAIKRPSHRLPAAMSVGGRQHRAVDLLASSALPRVLAELKERFDFVILDTPPVLGTADAAVIAPLVDAVILVARLGYTGPARLRHAAADLRRTRATVLGVVGNETRRRA